MPKTYELPPTALILLMEDLKEKYHERLINADVRIGVIMALGPKDPKTGQLTGPAIEGHAGAAAGACVKVVSLRDRLVKKYDVEMLVDGDQWPKLTAAQQAALIDHELTHIQPQHKVDDLNRPLVRMKDEDFIVWGFFDVAARHGMASVEAMSVKNLIDAHGQLFLGIPA